MSKHRANFEHKMGSFQLQNCESCLATVPCPVQALFRSICGPKAKLYREGHVLWLCHWLCSPTFVLNLGLMFDALEELSDFSLSLQDRSMTLHRADASLSRQIWILKSMAVSPGLKTQEARQAVELNIFKKSCTRTNKCETLPCN